MNRNICRSLALVLLAVSMTACYGPFNLTRKLHRWNGTVGDKWVTEGTFLVLTIVPVYELAAIADALVFNSLQFWTGKNPVTASIQPQTASGQETVMRYRPETRTLQVYNFRKGRPASGLLIEPGPGGMVARDRAGELLFTSKTEAGQVVVRDGKGKEVGRYDAAELQGRMPSEL